MKGNESIAFNRSNWPAAGKITGDIRISGHPKEQNSFARVSGYVEQTDIVRPSDLNILCLNIVYFEYSMFWILYIWIFYVWSLVWDAWFAYSARGKKYGCLCMMQHIKLNTITLYYYVCSVHPLLFCVQHSPFTTVAEALWLSARLRFGNDVDNKTAKAFIAEVSTLFSSFQSWFKACISFFSSSMRQPIKPSFCPQIHFFLQLKASNFSAIEG